MESSTFDAWTGRPQGPPEWPFLGGYLRQPARLVEAVSLFRTEIGYLDKPDKPKAKHKPKGGSKTR